ncbi:MAG: Zn-dependent hydrolase [Gemmatimonadetes bacterium]|nr:Zn-dependent hydrolase [Gemmatimonadota bacterium]
MTPRWTPLTLTLCMTMPAPACESGRVDVRDRLAQYATVRLEADTTGLTQADRMTIAYLIAAAAEMDTLFWDQAYGAHDSLLASIRDPEVRRYVEMNYGPWDRLRDNQPFLPGVGPKPAGANFYPADLTKAEFEAYLAAHPEQADSLKSLYALVRRGPGGSLRAVPYKDAYAMRLLLAAAHLRAAAGVTRDASLSRYLLLRSDALRSDEYRASDLAWMDMKSNRVDVVIGPIETYEDQLLGYKASYEAYVLIKDLAWSERLSRYAGFLPQLQRGLPVPERYKRETPGANADLNAYDVVYYAGEANAGAKTIAINLPNDETVQLEKGTRRLQLKNVMRAKFEKILVPMANLLIAQDQRSRITFDAFFQNVMFHEVAHGLGIKRTVTGKGTVREALKQHASALEEGKADVLGLYMVSQLRDRGALTGGSLEDNYVSFVASILRSVRFGATDAHGRANMVQFALFQELGALTRDSASGTYRVHLDRMPEAVHTVAERILTLQGEGDYEGAGRLLAEEGIVSPVLKADLNRLSAAGIPVDLVFEQRGAGLPTVTVK